MNHDCKNMKKYLNCEYQIEEIQQNILSRKAHQPGDVGKKKLLKSDQELKSKDMIHMFQNNIEGMNPIDIALEKNAIFSIKAYSDTLLILKDENLFRDCINQAVLLLIKRGIDVN